MPLIPGTRIGQYQVLGSLGAGGMGEVFRARDTTLNRDVAIKVLPDSVADDPDRRARFEREAQTLAACNHPRIAQIYGVIETADDDAHRRTALVMEYVEGEDLAQRLTRGPIPIDDAIAVAAQIAEGLEAAHERGIVHRDLKPANVKVAPDGSVKVLDFGLAKAVTAEATALPARSNSPTFTSPVHVTQAGSLLGTAPYLAPEQVRGKPVDRRVDIWAFGCVLFEMLVGHPPFHGESLADMLGAIVRDTPRWDDLPAATPPSIRRLLTRCLTREPSRRLRDIGEARIVLEDQGSGVIDDLAGPAATVPAPRWRTMRWTAIAILAIAATFGLAGMWLWGTSATPSTPIVRFDVLPPANASLTLEFRPAVALSRDGSMLAFTAVAEGVSRLYVRGRNSVDVRALAGTEGASLPSFSPDGRWIAFYAEGRIKKIALDGPPTTLASGPDVRGIAWLDDHTLIFPPGAADGLVAMSADGGPTRPVSKLTANERTHRWPDVLPGGKAVIFTVGSPASPDNYDDATIEAVVLATGERRVVWRGAAMARYSSSGHLILSRGAALYAVRFDPETLTATGNPTQVVGAVEHDVTTGAAHFACAADGTLAIIPGSAQSGQFRLAWVDAKGATEPLDLAPGMHHDLRISPDGRHVALLNGPGDSSDVWIYDLARHTNTRLTFTGNNAAPVWSSDGKDIFYTSFDDPEGRSSKIYRKPADGSREAEVVAMVPGRSYLAWLSKDRSDALLDFVNPGPGMADVVRMSLRTQEQPSAVVTGAADTYGASVSPDGRWVAYHSDDSGRPEIYVRDMAATGGRWQVSTGGGEEPHWSKDGRALYFRSGNRMMMAPITGGSTFEFDTPRLLFEGVYNLRSDSLRSYDVDPVTGRFLMIRPLDQGRSAGSIRVTLNWFEELRRLVATR